MTSVRKSPNMMSTTGRMPVMAAPSPIPVMPASEIGESSTRSGPNSSTSPEVTLNGVPASAMSSPIRKTVGSRRSSSASASLTACAREISRVPSCSLGRVTSAGALDGPARGGVNEADVLSVDLLHRDVEGSRPGRDAACRRLQVVGVLVVGVVLADVDHRKLPEGCHVHFFVEDSLAERALAEEADRYLIGAPRLG